MEFETIVLSLGKTHQFIVSVTIHNSGDLFMCEDDISFLRVKILIHVSVYFIGVCK